jgi:integrase
MKLKPRPSSKTLATAVHVEPAKTKDKEPVHLNNKFVQALPPDVMWWDKDPKASGFGIRTYPGGGRSFFLDYRINGRQKRHTIGPFPRWSADAARERAKELRKLIDRGQDPAGDKRARREAPTVQGLIDRYIEEHLPRKSGVDSRIEDEMKMLAEIGKHLGKHTKVADVHGGDIRDMHRKISESIGRYGPRRVRANRILAVCSKMFSLSLVPKPRENAPWRNQAQGNPCKGIERNHEEGRERSFSRAELDRIAEALNGYSGVAADCIRLIMLTGCRPGEAMQAEWSEFDKPGYWTKPSHHTKQRKLHSVPLNPPAIKLIDRLRAKRKGAFVFPGYIKGEPLQTIDPAWHHVRKHAQLAKDDQGRQARAYDLRHSYASHGVDGGLSLYVVGKLLGHTQSRTTEKYAHVADDPLREATNKIGDAIAGKPGAPAVPISGRRS